MKFRNPITVLLLAVMLVQPALAGQENRFTTLFPLAVVFQAFHGWLSSGARVPNNIAEQIQYILHYEQASEEAYLAPAAPAMTGDPALDAAALGQAAGQLNLLSANLLAELEAVHRTVIENELTTANNLIEQAIPRVAESTLNNPPPEFTCPITGDLMRDPVVAGDGHTYERAALESWLSVSGHGSPMTRQPLNRESIVPNRNLQTAIQSWVRANGGTLEEPARPATLGAPVAAPAASASEAAAAPALSTQPRVLRQTAATRIQLPSPLHYLPDTPREMDVPALTWGPYMPNQMTWAEAQTYAAANGMRLPTIHELLALREEEMRVLYDNRDVRWQWSSTAHNDFPNSAWCVEGFTDCAYWSNTDNRHAVRFVLL